MILAAMYPVFVWFMAYRFRRTVVGVALPVAAGLLVAVLAPLLRKHAFNGAEALVPLVYAESALVMVVGVWLGLMPRRRADERACGHCGYDLAGLDTDVLGAVCPECGGDVTPPSLRSCSTCSASLAGVDLTRSGQRCVRCGTILPVRGARRAKRQMTKLPNDQMAK